MHKQAQKNNFNSATSSVPGAGYTMVQPPPPILSPPAGGLNRSSIDLNTALAPIPVPAPPKKPISSPAIANVGNLNYNPNAEIADTLQTARDRLDPIGPINEVDTRSILTKLRDKWSNTSGTKKLVGAGAAAAVVGGGVLAAYLYNRHSRQEEEDTKIACINEDAFLTGFIKECKEQNIDPVSLIKQAVPMFNWGPAAKEHLTFDKAVGAVSHVVDPYNSKSHAFGDGQNRTGGVMSRIGDVVDAAGHVGKDLWNNTSTGGKFALGGGALLGGLALKSLYKKLFNKDEDNDYRRR